jgi:hypothetical protein
VIVTVNKDECCCSVSNEYLNLFQAKLFGADELEQIRVAGLTDLARWRKSFRLRPGGDSGAAAITS